MIVLVLGPIAALASIFMYFMHTKKVPKRVWLLVPFALITSIVCLKSAAGIVVDSIAVE